MVEKKNNNNLFINHESGNKNNDIVDYSIVDDNASGFPVDTVSMQDVEGVLGDKNNNPLIHAVGIKDECNHNDTDLKLNQKKNSESKILPKDWYDNLSDSGITRTIAMFNKSNIQGKNGEVFLYAQIMYSDIDLNTKQETERVLSNTGNFIYYLNNILDDKGLPKSFTLVIVNGFSDQGVTRKQKIKFDYKSEKFLFSYEFNDFKAYVINLNINDFNNIKESGNNLAWIHILENIDNTIFIFYGMDFSFIKHLFNLSNIRVSGTNNSSRKDLLSQACFKFCVYLEILGYKYSDVNHSYNVLSKRVVNKFDYNKGYLVSKIFRKGYHTTTKFYFKNNFPNKNNDNTTVENKKEKVTKYSNTIRKGSQIFNQLSEFLILNPSNFDTQLQIEESLYNYQYASLNKKDSLSIDYSLVNNKLTELLKKGQETLIKLMDNFIKNQDNDLIYLDKNIEINLVRNYLYKILQVVGKDYVSNIILGRVFLVISKNSRKTDETVNNKTTITLDLAKDLVNRYYFSLYLVEKKTKKDKAYNLSNWKINNVNLITELDETFMTYLGGILLEWTFTSNLLKIQAITKIDKKIDALIPTKDILNVLDKQVLSLPKKVPMIIKPNLYSKDILGGYLLNDNVYTDNLIIPNRLYKKQSEILDDNVIYDVVNQVSSIPYKINKEVLNYIINNPLLFGKEYINLDDIHPLSKKIKLTSKERTTLDSFYSKKELQENILGLAEVFSNVHEFYFPVRLDSRGRLYCISEYLNYQSSELAKSLLLFSRGETLYKDDYESINYLKVHGANCYGNRLDKKSFTDRVKWVDVNEKNIINYDNGILISKAENKFLFLAFCIEYNKWINCLNNHDAYFFETHLPVQLDASCNGYQHLSLLSLDSELAKELNLVESNHNEVPGDFYGFLAIKLTEYFKMKLKENNKADKDLKLSPEDKQAYERLSKFSLQRKIIKKSIMTIPYNVSSLQSTKYLKELFIDSDEKGWLYIEGEDIKLKYTDFSILAGSIKKVLIQNFNKLNKLIIYLKKVAVIMSELDLIIPWKLPSGVIVKQSYLETEKIQLKPFSYSHNKYTLKIKTKNLDKQKQVRAFMPNLIHSLDATSLTLLLNTYFKELEIINIFTVHDCFGVTANNITKLLSILKQIYIKIYSDSKYLVELDKGIREFIVHHYGDKCFIDNLTLVVNDKTYKFPDVEVVLGNKLDFNFNNLSKSKYILN